MRQTLGALLGGVAGCGAALAFLASGLTVRMDTRMSLLTLTATFLFPALLVYIGTGLLLGASRSRVRRGALLAATLGTAAVGGLLLAPALFGVSPPPASLTQMDSDFRLRLEYDRLGQVRFPGARPVSDIQGQASIGAQYSTTSTRADVVAFYENQLRPGGWRAEDAPGSQTHRWCKPGMRFSLSFEPEKSGSPRATTFEARLLLAADACL